LKLPTLLFRKLKNKSMKLPNIISGLIKDGNTNAK
jgi:hypothetical protein